MKRNLSTSIYHKLHTPQNNSPPVNWPPIILKYQPEIHFDPPALDNSEVGKAIRRAYRKTFNLRGYCGKTEH